MTTNTGKAKTGHVSFAAGSVDMGSEIHKAIQYQQSGDLNKAEEIYRKILAVYPNHPDSLHLLGLIAQQVGRADMAITLISNAIENNPQNPVYYNNLGNVHMDLGRLKQAVSCYQKALQLEPMYAEASFNLGNVLKNQGKVADAIRNYQKAIQSKSNYLEAYFNLATALKAQGKIDDAEMNYRNVLSIEPDSINAYFELAHLRDYREETKDIIALESIKKKERLSVEDAVCLHFAMGKLYADLGDHDKAFKNYHSGNECRKKLKDQDFNYAIFKQHICMFMEKFHSGFFEYRKDFGVDTEVPVFIVGMPRSGTTLVEQILSSHPKIYGIGELPDIRQMENRLHARYGGLSFPQVIASFDQATAKTFCRQYIDRLRSVSGGAIRVTDKMPSNFLRLWLIALLFPRAKIIHCRRHPLDTCISCYFTHFKEAHGFTNDLKVLGLYYRQYERLMSHWHQVLPMQILKVQYEELVEHQEAMSKKMIAFCELKWDERCLTFYKNKRQVDTASALQVKRKIYKTSIDRWKKYENFLAPLMEGLGYNGQNKPDL